jgi:hypothetical protein
MGITPDSPWQQEFDVANASITELEFWPRGRIRRVTLRGLAAHRRR